MKQIAENDKTIFYENSFSKNLTEYASSLKLKCVVAELKSNGDKEYLLIAENDNPIYAHTNYEAVAIRIDILKKLNN